ncbi:MAG: exonuclease SbcCD subunit D [Candidatus Promineifilaceae bacterium]
MPSSPKTIRLLHFADAHIDMVNYGRYDLATMLPMRVMDFLRALDQIIDRAISEPVDLVIFAGDAYKDRNPHPTFQRAWGERMMRLSNAGIPTLLLVGNHDVSPAAGRAHAIQEFDTLNVPHIFVGDKLRLFGPETLGLPVQVLTVPWISRHTLMTREDSASKNHEQLLAEIEDRVNQGINSLIETADASLPLILAAHATVNGAVYGSERAVMLGHELVLSGSVVTDRRLDYVALGHIHKHQCLNVGGQPPIVYSGSIERIDFGEAREPKGFVLADVRRGHTDWQFIPLQTRRFLDFVIETSNADTFMADILQQLPAASDVKDAICRIQLSYPRDWEPLLDENAIAERFRDAFSFQVHKRTLTENRSRLGDTVAVESLTPEELLAQYWRSIGLDETEAVAMQSLAREILILAAP